MKLILQLSYPLFETAKNLLIDAGLNDEDLENIRCIRNKYKKLPPKLVLDFSIAYEFNKTVAMDLKECTEEASKA